MKGPGSAGKEAARPASYTALCLTALLRAPGAILTLVTAVLGSPAASNADARGWLRSGRTPTWRADKAKGCHVTRAVAQTSLPPADLPSPPLPSSARPARSSRRRPAGSLARSLAAIGEHPGPGMPRSSSSPPDEGQKFPS